MTTFSPTSTRRSPGSKPRPTRRPAVTFVGASVAPAGPVTVSWRQIHDEARAVAAALQARGRSRGSRRPARTDQPVIDHRRAGLLAGRVDVDGAPATDAHGLTRGVHRIDTARSGMGTPSCSSSTISRQRLYAGRRRSTDGVAGGDPARSSERAIRRCLGVAAGGSRSAGHPPVHERVDERAEGRHDPRPRPCRRTSTRSPLPPALTRR